MAKKKLRARDLLLEQHRQKFGHRRRVVGSAGGHQFGLELQEAIARGDIPAKPGPGPKRPRNPNAAREIEEAQARSPGLLDAIRARLTGGRIGATISTADDFEKLEALEALSKELRVKRPGRARQALDDIREKLTGALAFADRIRSGLGPIGKTLLPDKLFSAVKDVVARLKGGALEEKLRGFGIGGEAPSTPMVESGFTRETPNQGAKMIGVSSSNVASLGWEPHDVRAGGSRNDLGTLYIQFRNGWLYKYADAPRWLYDGILSAPSKGRAVWGLIRRGLYPDGIPYGSIAREGYERIR